MPEMNLKEWWQQFREWETELSRDHPSGAVHLVILADRGRQVQGGEVKVTSPTVAARCLMNATHRLATEAEIVGYEAQQKVTARQIAAREQRMFGNDRYVVRLRPR